MEESRIAFLRRLVASPSPSGFEQAAQRVVREEMQQFADEVRTDVLGNIISLLNPAGKPCVMLTAHCDELGFMARYIDENGFIFFAPIGGYDPSTLPGERVEIHTPAGAIPGVIGRKAVHILSSDERKKAPEMNEMWIDIGAASKEEAQQLVPLGSVATRAAQMEVLRGDLVMSRAMDNKASVFAIVEAMRRLHTRRSELKASVAFVSSVQEEIGGRGAAMSAYSLNPRIALIADMTFASDHPLTSKMELGDVKLHGGPAITQGAFVSPRVYELLTRTADEAGIARQLDLQTGGTYTDNDSVRLAGGGIATGLLNIPCRYMHTGSEVVSLKDIEDTAELMARFVLSIDESTNVIP
jgi:tetrahedral aminopeptidase